MNFANDVVEPQGLAAARRVAARFSMQGRRALVTGGSISIGRAIVMAFADAGADVAIQFAREADAVSGHPGAAEELAGILAEQGVRHALLDADFGVAGEAARAFAAAEQALGGIDVLVLCASIQQRNAFVTVTSEERERQTRINFHSSFELLQAAVPRMKARGWGRILTIGSVNETRPDPELAVYAALKCAQHNLALNLARQLADSGVTVNNLSPGLVATVRNQWRRVDENAWREIQSSANPMRRAAAPEEMTGAALLLCSDAGRFITGADLQATGGAHL
jgi:NAD(P)-dependent dehydrogenase (short-subunit alcohol dehydrogenase family)